MKHVPMHEVESVAHDAFVRVYQSLPTFRHDSDLKHWISRIAVRTAYDYWRERYRSREVTMSSLGEDQARWLEQVASSESGRRGEIEEDQRNARDLLAWAMNRLSAEDRTVLELVHIEERSVRETAELLGWSVANVKIRAFRARKKLRSILERELERRGEER
jgi:RNA polymerase sigma-70 factor (ECF subfamily)